MTLLDLQHALTYIVNHWHVIAAYLAGGLSISLLLQWLKRHFKLDQKTIQIVKLIRLDGPRIVVTLLTIFTTIGTIINYLIDPVNAQYIPKEFTFLLTAAFFIHRFMVSPLGLRIERILKPYWLAIEQIKKNEKVNPEVSSDPLITQPFTLDQQK